MATVTLNLSEEQWELAKTIAAKEGVPVEAWLQKKMDESLATAARRQKWWPTREEFLAGMTPDKLHGPREGLFEPNDLGEPQ